MAGFISYKERRVIPRWRTFDKTLRSGELNSFKKNRNHYHKVPHGFLADKIRDWIKYKTAAHAADLIGSANIVLPKVDDVNIIDAAKFLLKKDMDVPLWVREIAKKTLGINAGSYSRYEVNEQFLYKNIHLLRQMLRLEPNDPIIWVEISRIYACLGFSVKAQKSMTVALQLARNNRFVLRAASRLWIYLDDIERAHHILIRSDQTPYDPWLLSAEIAIGSISDRTPKFIRSARQMIMEKDVSIQHLSELASALATLECLNGNINKAKKLFRKSLIKPTENSVAQAEWASRYKHGSIHVNNRHLETPNTFEAKSLIYYHNSQWKDALKECNKWQSDQPFSSRPCGYGSYISSVALEDYSSSKEFASQGLKANPHDFTLMNNLTYALIKNNDISEAKNSISKMKKLNSLYDKEKLVLNATLGLWEFKNDNIDHARQLYMDALIMARKMNDKHLLASTSVFFALEEITQENPDQSVISEAFNNMKRAPDPIFKVLTSRLTQLQQQKGLSIIIK